MLLLWTFPKTQYVYADKNSVNLKRANQRKKMEKLIQLLAKGDQKPNKFLSQRKLYEANKS